MTTDPHARRPLWLRLATTLAVLALTVAARHVPLPFVDHPDSTTMHPVFSIVTLGLTPLVGGYLLVELAALIVPRWRRRRLGGYDERALLERLALAATLVLSAAAAVALMRYLHWVGWGPEEAWAQASLTVTIVTGPFLLVGLARAIDRWGAGGGLSLLIALELGLDVLPSMKPSQELTADERMRYSILIALLVGALVVVLARNSRQLDARLTLPVPATGLVPFTAAVSVWELGSKGFGAYDEDAWSVYWVILLATTVVLSIAFHWPPRLRAFAARTGIATSSVKRAVVAATALAFVTLAALDLVASWLGPVVGVHEVVALATVVAVGVDVYREAQARTRLGDLVPVWPMHRVYAVGPAIAALREHGIAAHARSFHHRSLLQFFGPYVPCTILVPAERASEAEQVLGEVLGAPVASAAT